MMAWGLRGITVDAMTRMVWEEWPEFFRGMDRVLAQVGHNLAFEHSWRLRAATPCATTEESADRNEAQARHPM